MTEVVAALIWEQNKFMICQRPAHKARGLLWEFVGGKVEPGETREQALIRECQEELAISLEVGDVFMDVIHKYPDLTVHLTLFHADIMINQLIAHCHAASVHIFFFFHFYQPDNKSCQIIISVKILKYQTHR